MAFAYQRRYLWSQVNDDPLIKMQSKLMTIKVFIYFQIYMCKILNPQHY